MMRPMRFLTTAMLLLCGVSALAGELVGVRGSNTRFTTTMGITIGDKPVQLVLTGAALRQKVFVNVYAISSYLMEGVTVRSAEELAVVDQPKQLHLVMERDVTGRDIAEAFRVAIRKNYPEPDFNDEVNHLAEKMRGVDFRKDDHIYLTHLPGVGLRCQVVNKGDFTIANPDFSRAVWEIYLGKNNLGDGIKKGLISRLRK